MGKARARKYYKSLARLKIVKEPKRTSLPGSNEGTARVEPIKGHGYMVSFSFLGRPEFLCPGFWVPCFYRAAGIYLFFALKRVAP
jgi:hypothetical protein